MSQPPTTKKEHAPSSTWCNYCASITLSSLTSPRGYHHHNSYENFRTSAQTCECCKLLFDLLHLSDDEEVDQEWAFQVVLMAWVGPTPHMYHMDGRPMYKAGKSALTGFTIEVKNSCTCRGYYVKDFRGCKGMWCASGIRKASCGIFTENDTSSFVHKVVCGRPVAETTEDESVTTVVQEWTDECCQLHEDCKINPSSPIGFLKATLPKRVVDVRPFHSEYQVKIVPYDGKSTYLALSHRWTSGPMPDWVTRKSNVSLRNDEFHLETLGKTVQDAISATRKLGCHFIWIDSLCIVQDDEMDWTFEAANMAGIYTNAMITISADSADDDDAGFLGKRVKFGEEGGSLLVRDDEQSREYLEVRLRYKNQIPTATPAEGEIFEIDVLSSPLSKRAWITQERILSPRILHYGKHQVFWECWSSCFAEDGHKFGQGTRGDRIAPFLRVLHDNSLTSKDIYRAWLLVIQDYAARKLSRETDKLPALSGMARIVSKRTNDAYLAGLWQGNLHMDLLWRTHAGYPGTKTPAEWRAPSWSWMAWDCQISNYILNEQRLANVRDAEPPQSAIRVLEVETNLKTADEFGQISGANIRLRGVLRPAVNIGPFTKGIGGFGPGWNPIYDADNNMIPIGNADFDDRKTSVIGRVFCLKVVEITPLYKQACLVLAATGRRKSEFRRIGLGVLQDRYYGEEGKDFFQGYEEQDIILV